MKRSKGYNRYPHIGTHYIVEFLHCSRIDQPRFIGKVLKEAAEAAGATIIATKIHRFSPRGVTGFVLLAESHISIHTWPEYGFIAVDIFTCGKNMRPRAAVNVFTRAFLPQKVVVRKLRRGHSLHGA